jgi:uncharacterized protein
VNFTHTTFIAAPVERVFAFFAEASNLALLTPARFRFRILEGPVGRPLREGDRIEYALRFLGVPLRWSSRIVAWRENEVFADRQERGPFRSWLHTHRLVAVEGGTEMRDDIEYELPLGLLGRLTAGWVIRHMLREVFAYRGEALRRQLERPTEAHGR